MTTFTPLAQAQLAAKGNIIVKILDIGTSVAGTTKTGTAYIRRDVKVTDGDTEMTMTVWDGKFDQYQNGEVLKIVSPYWQNKDGKISVSPGKFAVITKGTDADLFANRQQNATQPNQTLTAPTNDTRQKVLRLIQLEKEIRETFISQGIPPVDVKVGLYLKLLTE